APDLKLGVAWYLYPDEIHNGDGRHITYLDAPEQWRYRDPRLFDALARIVSDGQRAVSAVEKSGLLGNARYASALLDFECRRISERRLYRQKWFEEVLGTLADCELVFADPDNGLCEDER